MVAYPKITKILIAAISIGMVYASWYITSTKAEEADITMKEDSKQEQAEMKAVENVAMKHIITNMFGERVAYTKIGDAYKVHCGYDWFLIIKVTSDSLAVIENIHGE